MTLVDTFAYLRSENRQESQPQREYSSAIAPYNIPVGVAYKTIAAFMKANRRNRLGGPIDKDVKVSFGE
jgi:hypothetical protein